MILACVGAFIMVQTSYIWVQLTTQKYVKESHILRVKIGKRDSYSWCSIVKGAYILSSGFITRVGRSDISIWYEKWLSHGRLCKRIPPVEQDDINLCIKDICHNGV